MCGYNGSFSGSVSWATGKRGSAIDFAGGNINSNNSTPFNFGNNSFSVGAWFKLDTTTGYKTIVSKGAFWGNDDQEVVSQKVITSVMGHRGHRFRNADSLIASLLLRASEKEIQYGLE